MHGCTRRLFVESRVRTWLRDTHALIRQVDAMLMMMEREEDGTIDYNAFAALMLEWPTDQF